MAPPGRTSIANLTYSSDPTAGTMVYYRKQLALDHAPNANNI